MKDVTNITLQRYEGRASEATSCYFAIDVLKRLRVGTTAIDKVVGCEAIMTPHYIA